MQHKLLLEWFEILYFRPFKIGKSWIASGFLPRNDKKYFRPNWTIKHSSLSSFTLETIKLLTQLGFSSQIKTQKKRLEQIFSLFFIGPGGIRTHDQRIMSPLRYRCATGPWRVLLNFQFALGSALAGKLRFRRYLPLLERYSIILVGRVPQARGVFY